MRAPGIPETGALVSNSGACRCVRPWGREDIHNPAGLCRASAAARLGPLVRAGGRGSQALVGAWVWEPRLLQLWTADGGKLQIPSNFVTCPRGDSSRR